MATKANRFSDKAARRNSSGLTRDVEILEVLVGPHVPPEGIGVVRIAQLLGRDKATVSRAMATLADAGLLARDEETRLYRVGPRIFSLAARSAEAALTREAKPFLRQIARHSGETAHLNVLRGGQVLTILSELSPKEVRTVSWEGRTSDPLRTPSGRVLVCEWTDSELADWYADHNTLSQGSTASNTPLPPVADDLASTPRWLASVEGTRAVHDLSSLLAEAARIRKYGFAISDEEYELGVAAASAPVRDHTDAIIAALTVSAPKERVGSQLPRLGVYISRAAEQLSRHLGAAPRTHEVPKV